MKKLLLIGLSVFALGLSLSALQQNATSFVREANPMGVIEQGTWYCDDDGAGNGGPWSPQPVMLTVSNTGLDFTIYLTIYGADGSVVSTDLVPNFPDTFNVPAGGTVTVWDPTDEDSLGASGRYSVED